MMNSKEAFSEWWDDDRLCEDNPYVQGTPAFWAWEGWKAATERAADVTYWELDDPFLSGHGYATRVSEAIREGND